MVILMIKSKISLIGQLRNMIRITAGILAIPVFRVEKNANYTTMSNYHLRDSTISFKAKGILSMFLSLPKDWSYSVSGLSLVFGCLLPYRT